jgi:MYXO-CTERM domain-containing protein
VIAKRLMTLVTLAGALAAAPDAAAQAISLNQATPPRLVFDRAACTNDAEIEVEWYISASAPSYYWNLVLQDLADTTAGENTCPDANQIVGEVLIPRASEPTQTENGSFDRLFDLPATQLMGEGACDATGKRGIFLLCLYMYDITLDQVASFNIPMDIDTQVPDEPTVATTAGDGRLTVAVGGVDDTAGDIYSYIVQYRPCAFAGDLDAGVPDGGGTATVDGGIRLDEPSTCDSLFLYTQTTEDNSPFEITGLVNGRTYEVRVAARDDFGNTSGFSAEVTDTPEQALSPLDLYEGTPNPFSVEGPDFEELTQGNCSSTGKSGNMGLALLGGLVLLLRRRSRTARRALGNGRALSSLVVGLALVGGLGAAAPASADIGQLTVGAKVGPYYPAIDREVAGGQLIYPIYKCFFDDRTFPAAAVDIDVHVFDLVGSLELGLGMGFTQLVGTELPLEAGSAANVGTRTCVEPPRNANPDSVELTLAFLKPQVTYRLDPLLDYFGFPLVPYGRAALVGAGYAWTRKGAFDNDSANVGQNPLGVRFGYELALGMMLNLDWIDMIGVWDFLTGDKDRTKAHPNDVLAKSYIFIEGVTMQVDNFGSPGFNLSAEDRLFETRLPWTFNAGIAVELF